MSEFRWKLYRRKTEGRGGNKKVRLTLNVRKKSATIKREGCVPKALKTDTKRHQNKSGAKKKEQPWDGRGVRDGMKGKSVFILSGRGERA